MSELYFVQEPWGQEEQPAATDGRPSAEEALDAYSQVVTGVARDLAPSVANLRAVVEDGSGNRFLREATRQDT